MLTRIRFYGLPVAVVGGLVVGILGLKYGSAPVAVVGYGAAMGAVLWAFST